MLGGWVVLHSFYEWNRLLTQDSRQEALLTIHRLLLMKLLNQCWKSNEDQDTTCVLKTVKVNILHTVRPMKCSDNVDNIDNIWQFCGNVDNLFAKEWGAVSLFARWTISFTKRPGDDLLRASLALVIYSYCVRAAKPSQALLLFYWGYSASIAGTALFDW